MSIWGEVNTLFADAERASNHMHQRLWRDADPDSEEVARHLRAILAGAVANAENIRDSIRQRNSRILSFGYGLPEGRDELLRDAKANVTYLRDALEKTNRQVESMTSTGALGDALDRETQRHGAASAAQLLRRQRRRETQRHDWSNLLQKIGGFLSTWKLKNVHKFISDHAEGLEEDVVQLLMVQDPDQKTRTTALIFKALDIDEALKTIQNISFMSADAIYKACPDLSRDKPEPSLSILRNQCFEDRIRYLLATRKHMSFLKEGVARRLAETPQARGDVRQKIRGKVKLMERILAGKLSQRPRRSGTKYSTTTLSPIAARALSTILYELTLLEPTTRSPMEMDRLTIAWTGHGGVLPVLKKLSKLDLPVNIEGQIEVLQGGIEDRVVKTKKGGRRTRRKRRSHGNRRTRYKRRHKRRKSRRRRKRGKRYTRR